MSCRHIFLIYIFYVEIKITEEIFFKKNQKNHAKNVALFIFFYKIFIYLCYIIYIISFVSEEKDSTLFGIMQF